MRVTGGFVLAAGAALMLSGCATTSVASTPVPVTEAPTTTLPPTTTTVAPTTTLPPTTTTAAPTTTTIPPTTTTTVPANLVPVPVSDPPIVAVGTDGGAETRRAQERLLQLGFWLQAADGSYGLTTRQAVMAFQKYYGIEADGVLGAETAAVMSGVTQRPIGRADAGTLVEIDKGKQLLMFVIDGKTEWILNTSTGNGEEYTEPDQNTPGEMISGVSLTPDGLHSVNRQREEGWWEGDLGKIYRPKYFVGGVAVHGSSSIPNYPASHGCVRVSVPAMDWIWDAGILPLHTPVWVHQGKPS